MTKLDTSIDRLVEFVRMKKSCTVDQVAKSLGAPVKQIEELAEILAESGLIDVRYEFSGIRLSPKIVKKETEEERNKGVSKKLTTIERLDGIKRELNDAEKMFEFSEKDIRRKVDNAKVHFKEIEKLDLSAENSNALRNKMKELDSSIKVFEDKIDSLEKAALDMRKEVDEFEAEIGKHEGPKDFGIPAITGLLAPIIKIFKGKNDKSRVDAK